MSNINHPQHYKSGQYECIDVMLETQGITATMNFCICNALKYLCRHKNKNGIEDIKKAKWYLDKYIELDEQMKKDMALVGGKWHNDIEPCITNGVYIQRN